MGALVSSLPHCPAREDRVLLCAAMCSLNQIFVSLCSAPMKERLSNFSSDADDNSTTGGSSLEDTSERISNPQEVPPNAGTDSPAPSSVKKISFLGKIRKVPAGGGETLRLARF